MTLTKLVFSLLIVGIFLDSFQTKLSTGVHIINVFLLLFLLINWARKTDFSYRNQKLAGTELIALLVFFLYLTLNANIFCCQEFGFRILLRLGYGIFLYVSFSKIDWSKVITQLLYMLNFLNIFAGLLSILGLINKDLWLKFWSILLSEQSYGLQLYEINRGRISVTFPVFMSIIASLAIMFSSNSKLQRIIGSLGMIFGMFSIIFWGYRSYIIATLAGISIFLFLLERLKKLSKIKNNSSVLYVERFVVIIIPFLVIFHVLISNYFSVVNIVDRFMLVHSIDQKATAVRWDFLQNSIEMFSVSPLIGVGIGNSRIYQKPLDIHLVSPEGQRLGANLFYLPIDPHNIFLEYLSETGIIGIFLMFLTLMIFLITDLHLLRSLNVLDGSREKNDFAVAGLLAVLVSSWIFIFSVQFTSYTKSSLYLFFIFRGIIVSWRQRYSFGKFRI